MNRYKVSLKPGIIKNAQLRTAGVDLEKGDVVVLSNEIAMPMYSEEQDMYGVAAANAKKGGKVLIAAKELNSGTNQAGPT